MYTFETAVTKITRKINQLCNFEINGRVTKKDIKESINEMNLNFNDGITNNTIEAAVMLLSDYLNEKLS